MTAINASTDATLAAGFCCGERTFFKTSSIAASINDHFSGLIGCRCAWFLSQAASRSPARDFACEASPARSTLSRSSAMALKPERSPSGLVAGGDLEVGDGRYRPRQLNWRRWLLISEGVHHAG